MQPVTVCAHELVEASVSANPDAIALVAGDIQLSYRELNSRANQLAHFLRHNGVGPDVLVALCLRRTAELLVGILGILKAGGAYVPMDPSYPTERVSLMIDDSQADILLTTADLGSGSFSSGLPVVRLDADWPAIARNNGENPRTYTTPDNLAYVIYTSGSTGRPKGVMVTHAGLANYLLWAAREYGPEAARSALVHSSISFDLTITGLLTPLLLGGRVELLAQDDAIDGLLAALQKNGRYGLVKITPAHLDFLSNHLDPKDAAGAVGLFVIGGENLDAEKLRFWRQFSPTTRLINEYGPTETVVGCCTYEIKADDPDLGPVPIGKPIANTTFYVLDENMRAVPTGATGELYIGGVGVARGYLRLPELSRERFVADPFSPDANARLYKSGDLVRRRGSGVLEYLGRYDHQVKFHGYRIELGEIEAAITEHPAIRQNAVKMVVDGVGDKKLVCYAVQGKNATVTAAGLRDYLRRKLPPYMVPNLIVFLDELPLTLNGKIDRRALPPPDLMVRQRQARFDGASNDSKRKLVSIFQEVLGLEKISVSDNFFDLGGDSFLMLELLLRIEAVFETKLSTATVFEAPTVSQLTDVLQTKVQAPTGIIPIQPEGALSPFFCIGAGPLFRPLASYLGRERPFLGVAPMLQPGEASTIEEIAAAALTVICRYQQEGPYWLGGWSASGVVAYEVAQQLVGRGHRVDFLALFDVKNPEVSQPIERKRGEAYRQKMRFWVEELRGIELSQLPDYFSEKARELKRKIRQGALRTGFGPEPDPTQAAVSGYRPLPYEGGVTFFRAGSRPQGEAWDFSLGWQHLVSGGFEIHEVPGNHQSMFSEPNVKVLAKKMSLYLAANLLKRSTNNLAVATLGMVSYALNYA